MFSNDLLQTHRFETADGVTLNVVETGNKTGRPILFVHGISQSWRSWSTQFENAELRSKHRLVAFDLRGHGRSQGAIGAVDAHGKRFHSLPDEFYNDGDSASTSGRWAGDVAAVVDGLGLSEFLLVGWSYGGVVTQDYLVANGGLGKAGKVLLLSTIPGVQPPGTPEIGGDVLFKPAAIDSLMRSTTVNLLGETPSPNDGRTIVAGLTDFVVACAADDRPAMCDADVIEALAYNLSTPAAVRLAIMLRAVDNRPFFSGLSGRDRERIHAVTGDADGIFHADVLAALWGACGIRHELSPGAGHMPMMRNAATLDRLLASLAAD